MKLPKQQRIFQHAEYKLQLIVTKQPTTSWSRNAQTLQALLPPAAERGCTALLCTHQSSLLCSVIPAQCTRAGHPHWAGSFLRAAAADSMSVQTRVLTSWDGSGMLLPDTEPIVTPRNKKRKKSVQGISSPQEPGVSINSSLRVRLAVLGVPLSQHPEEHASQ